MRTRTVILAAVGICLAAGLSGLDWLLARPDRIAAADRYARLVTVRDEVLRFEYETGRLPPTLEALVPDRLAPEFLSAGGQPLYVYEPAHRLLREREGPLLRGVFARRRAPRAIDLPPPEAAAAPAPKPPRARLHAPTEPTLPPPPAGALVFEAERYTETNYAWEAHEDAACGGGAFLHCKEGIGNGPGQTGHCQVGDFYNLGDVRELSRLRYHLRIPKTGDYYVYGRFWTTNTHCSNHLCVAFDKGGPGVGAMDNRTPFRWVWSPVSQDGGKDPVPLLVHDGGKDPVPLPVHLEAGDHFLHVFIHEDGVRVDQYLLSPAPLEDVNRGPFAANFAPGAGTAWAREPGPPAHLAFDIGTQVLSPDFGPDARLTVRRLQAATGAAHLLVRLRGAGANGADAVLAETEVDLAALPELAFLPLDFGGVAVGTLPRREFPLTAELTRNGVTLAAAHLPLMRPWAWEVLGPGRYLPNGQPGPLDGDAEFPPGDKRAWTPFLDASYDPFGVLDFGLQFYRNSLNPSMYKTVYARTRFSVPQTGVYLLKIQSDDQLLLWLDGRLVWQDSDSAPVTRSAYRVPLRLDAGEHRLRIRVNQRETRWQAYLRFRTEKDQISDLVGLEGEPRPTTQQPNTPITQ